MIVILSYFLDGSGQPKLKFFPKGDGQVREVIVYIEQENALGKNVEIHEIESVELPALQIK